MADEKPSKLLVWVRFPLSAPRARSTMAVHRSYKPEVKGSTPFGRTNGWISSTVEHQVVALETRGQHSHPPPIIWGRTLNGKLGGLEPLNSGSTPDVPTITII